MSYLKLALPNLSNCKISQKKKKKHKRLNLGPKMPYFIFGYFGARILKNLLSYLRSAPSICVNAKFREKMKMPKFGYKTSLLRYIWARIFKKLLSYLKSAPSNLTK